MSHVFYKSFLHKWIAIKEEKSLLEVWYSENGDLFYPLKATRVTDGIHLENNLDYGQEHWIGAVRKKVLNDGTSFLKLDSTQNGGRDKPIFRIQEYGPAGAVFDPMPQFRRLYEAFEITQIHKVILLTGFNRPYYSPDTKAMYYGNVGGAFEKAKIMAYSDDYQVITTNFGVLDSSNHGSTYWEGYLLKPLNNWEEYEFEEDSRGVKFKKK